MQPMNRDRRLLLFIYSLALLQGLTIMLMPSLFRSVGKTFHVGMAQQGELQSAFYFGVLAIGLAGGVLFERLGTKATSVASILLISVGSLTIGLAPEHWILIAGGVLFGMGNGCLSVVFRAAVADRFNMRRQKVFTWAMLFLAVGGSIGPYMFSFLLKQSPSWRIPLVGLGALLAGVALTLRLLRTPALDAIHAKNEPREGSYLAVLRSGRLWLTTVLFLLHGFAGSILVAWVGRLYQDRLSITDGQAALLLSVNAAGFFIGRLILGTWLAGKLPDRTLLGICASAGTVAFVLVDLGGNYILTLILMAGFGVVMSGDAPSIYSLVGRHFARDSGVAFALVQAMGAVGSTTGPWLIGWLGEHYGLRTAVWFGPFFLLALAIMTLTWEFVERRKILLGNASGVPEVSSGS
jgi:MFS family permease